MLEHSSPSARLVDELAQMRAAEEEVGRLAFRIEGDYWQAYYALPDTMDGALELGKIQMAIVRVSAERKEAFAALMWAGVADIIEAETGERPHRTDPVRAPEHERAGRA